MIKGVIFILCKILNSSRSRFEYQARNYGTPHVRVSSAHAYKHLTRALSLCEIQL